jgi:hypothetical protein
MKTLKVLAVALAIGFAFSASAKSTCKSCDDLKAIRAEYVKQKNASDETYNSLQLKASTVIQSMGTKLSSEQLDALVDILAVAVPVDPAEAIVVRNLDIIQANRKEIQKRVKKLAKPVAQRIEDAIETADGEDANGNNPRN